MTHDFWENPYRMQSFHDIYQFWSYGPDGKDDTKDDLWVDLPKDF